MTNNILDNLKSLIVTPDLASKRWIYEQYDSQVMNDTIQTGGDAAIVRVHGTNKALAISTDCTPRYVEADPFMGAMQAVVETYRNISAVGGKPLAITNCLNFGNPQKPEIMGQIVRSIKGITEACKVLDYPVVSGNVSLYNETNGSAIQPTPAIGGVGLLKDLSKRCDINFKKNGDIVLVVGKTEGHIGSSLYEREILKIEKKNSPPQVNLETEKNHSELVRNLIEHSKINACHDISDGGILVALFEMCNNSLGINIDLSQLKSAAKIDENHLLFGEDQGRYIISVAPENLETVIKLSSAKQIDLFKVGEVINDNIFLLNNSILVSELKALNENVFRKNFA
jgi:phosphoribosylformylglycinamidine synthase